MAAAHRFPVPSVVPGTLITNYDDLNNLKEHLANLCGLRNLRFPGSQPVSFTTQSIDLLASEDFWVCEKSDGVRVLVLAVGSAAGPELYLIDRKENFYLNHNFILPHHEDPDLLHCDTLLDGELVIDVDADTGKQHLRLLAFDCLILDGVNVMRKPLSSRYGRLVEYVHKPYRKFLEQNPEFAENAPFEMVVKTMEKAYGIEAVFREHLPSLRHGTDGLIFTSAVGDYVTGTDPRILKWKPPSENSIDFRLELRFPPVSNRPAEPDLCAKPTFLLMMSCGQDPETFFDFLIVTDDEWQAIKESSEQYDNRVVEVVWDAEHSGFRMLRFRDDKREGNFRDIVYKIIKSIQDGVEADELIASAGRIKGGWRQREMALRQPPPTQKPAAPIVVAAPENALDSTWTSSLQEPQMNAPVPSTRTLRL